MALVVVATLLTLAVVGGVVRLVVEEPAFPADHGIGELPTTVPELARKAECLAASLERGPATVPAASDGFVITGLEWDGAKVGVATVETREGTYLVREVEQAFEVQRGLTWSDGPLWAPVCYPS